MSYKESDMWAAIIQIYWQVILFKRTPDNTPYSHLLLGVALLCFFIVLGLQWQFVNDVKKPVSFLFSVVAGISVILSYLLYTFFLLFAVHRVNRLIQTVTCLLAGHTIVHVLAFPLLLFSPLLKDGIIPQPLALLIGIVYLLFTLLLTAWQFMITAYIYKHALEIEYIPAFFASVGLLAVNILMISLWR